MELLEQDILTKELATLGKALSNPLRWTLLSLLAQCEKPVQRIAEQAGQPIANISIQLRVLQEAGLVQSRREGKYVYYDLSSPQVRDMLMCVQTTAAALHPGTRLLVQEAFEDESDVREEEFEVLLDEVRGGRAILVDLRHADDFESGHLPGAIHIPLRKLHEHTDELAARKLPVVLYCRGPFCVTSVNGLRLLREHGIQTRRLPVSVHRWKELGLALENTLTAV